LSQRGRATLRIIENFATLFNSCEMTPLNRACSLQALISIPL